MNEPNTEVVNNSPPRALSSTSSSSDAFNQNQAVLIEQEDIDHQERRERARSPLGLMPAKRELTMTSMLIAQAEENKEEELRHSEKQDSSSVMNYNLQQSSASDGKALSEREPREERPDQIQLDFAQSERIKNTGQIDDPIPMRDDKRQTQPRMIKEIEIIPQEPRSRAKSRCLDLSGIHEEHFQKLHEMLLFQKACFQVYVHKLIMPWIQYNSRMGLLVTNAAQGLKQNLAGALNRPDGVLATEHGLQDIFSEFISLHASIGNIFDENLSSCKLQMQIAIKNKMLEFHLDSKGNQHFKFAGAIQSLQSMPYDNPDATLNQMLQVAEEMDTSAIDEMAGTIGRLKARIKCYRDEKFKDKQKVLQQRYIDSVEQCKQKLDKLQKSKRDPEQMYIISKQERYQEQTKEIYEKMQRRKQQLVELKEQEAQRAKEFETAFKGLCKDELIPYQSFTQQIWKSLHGSLLGTMKVLFQRLSQTITEQFERIKDIDQRMVGYPLSASNQNGYTIQKLIAGLETCPDDEIDHLFLMSQQTLQETYQSRLMLFLQVKEMIVYLQSFMDQGLKGIIELVQSYTMEDLRTEIGSLQSHQTSKEHTEWYSMIKGQLMTDLTRHEEGLKHARNFVSMIEKISSSLGKLLEITLEEKQYFSEDMLNVFRILNDSFTQQNADNRIGIKLQVIELLKEASIFIEQVDLRKDEYLQTIMNNIIGYLTNLDLTTFAIEQRRLEGDELNQADLDAVLLLFKQTGDLAEVYQIQKSKLKQLNQLKQQDQIQQTSIMDQRSQILQHKRHVSLSRPQSIRGHCEYENSAHQPDQRQMRYLDPRFLQSAPLSFQPDPYQLNNRMMTSNQMGLGHSYLANQHNQYQAQGLLPGQRMMPQSPLASKYQIKQSSGARTPNQGMRAPDLYASLPQPAAPLDSHMQAPIYEPEQLPPPKKQLSNNQLKMIDALRNNDFASQQPNIYGSHDSLDSQSPRHGQPQLKLNLNSVYGSNLEQEGRAYQTMREARPEQIRHPQTQTRRERRHSRPQSRMKAAGHSQGIAMPGAAPEGSPFEMVDLDSLSDQRTEMQKYEAEEQKILQAQEIQFIKQGSQLKHEQSPRRYSDGSSEMHSQSEKMNIQLNQKVKHRQSRSTGLKKSSSKSKKETEAVHAAAMASKHTSRGRDSDSASSDNSSFDIESAKFNKSRKHAAADLPPYIQTRGDKKILIVDSMSPKTKYVYDNFGNNHNQKQTKIELPGPQSQNQYQFINTTGNNIEDGEIIIDAYQCAIQMKILIQGKLSVSNQALYFHSYFNDSLLFFGKETKIKVPISNIKDISKAKNAKIFDNSIELKLYNGSVIFITSFISRDDCYKLIVKQMKRIKYIQGKKLIGDSPKLVNEKRTEALQPGPVDSPPAYVRVDKKSGSAEKVIASSPKSSHARERQSKIQKLSQKEEWEKDVQMQPQPELFSDAGDKNAPSDGHIQEESAPPPPKIEDINIWPICSHFELSDQLAQIENERMEKIKKLIPKYKDGFSWQIFKGEFDCPMKFMVQNSFYDHKNKYECLQNRSLFGKVQELLANSEFEITNAGTENQALKYFMNYDLNEVTESELNSWPLQGEAFEFKYTHTIDPPKPMHPASTQQTETHTDFYVSPRKFIRYVSNQGAGFMYAENFVVRGLQTVTMLDNNRCELKIEYQVDILKAIMFIQAMVVKESEAATRAAFKDSWEPKIHELVAQVKQEYESTQKQVIFEKQLSEYKQKYDSLIRASEQPKQAAAQEEQKLSAPIADAKGDLHQADSAHSSPVQEPQPATASVQASAEPPSASSVKPEIANVPHASFRESPNTQEKEQIAALRQEVSDLKDYLKMFALIVFVLQLMQMWNISALAQAPAKL